MSVVTLAELRYGVYLVNESAKRVWLEGWLDGQIRPWFLDSTLPVSENVLVRWRVLMEVGRKTGRIYPQPDLLLAATALEHDLALVTRNERDFVARRYL